MFRDLVFARTKRTVNMLASLMYSIMMGLAASNEFNEHSTIIAKDGSKLVIHTERPTWKAGESICNDLHHFKAFDSYPIRSPLVVADFFAPIVKDKNFCEIGSRNGDISACVMHFASSVSVIELDQKYCKILEKRGLNVLCKAVETVTVEEFRERHCDVYFWWPMDPRTQNELWLKQIKEVQKEIGTHATVYIAHDTHWHLDMQMLPKLAASHNGSIERVFFDEGGDLFGEPSYSRAWADRPGRWGVMHLLSIVL